MISLENIVEGAALAVAGGLASFIYFRWKEQNSSLSRTQAADAALAKARAEAEAVVRDAKLAAVSDGLKLREEIERSLSTQRTEVSEQERRLAERERLINSQLERILETEKNLHEQKAQQQQQSQRLEERERELTEVNRQAREQLQRMTGLNEAEAKAEFLRRIEGETQAEGAHLARNILDEARTKAETEARRIISVAIQRYAGEHTFENTTAAIALQGDEIKGRIIGREGRNIRAFEAATGVTVLIDDTPGAVLLSGFDPVRREVAREAMARLIQDGRIHPTRIEEVVSKVNQEMDATIVRLGEDAVTRAGLPPLHPEVVKLLGRLHFRHSFSQNILDHSVEVAHLMGLLAAELGVDIQQAKRAGLLHDIGKAVNHEVEGPHALVGADFIRRFGESEAVVNGVASHHNDVQPQGPLGILVSAADAISASRPGARSESMSIYLKRVEDLEKIAAGFTGVEKAYAVQAGRELRVFVQPEQIADDEAFGLARKIVSRIETELQYPGQIKVTVIRETRCIEVAK